MSGLAESLVGILTVGGLLIALLVAVYVVSKRRTYLAAAALALVVTLLLVLWERATVTPREQLRATVMNLAEALEQNDLPRVMGFIAQDSDQLVAEAQRMLPRVEIQEAKVKSNLEVNLGEGTDSVGEARFNAVIVGRDAGGQSPWQRYPARFTLHFRHEADGWKVTDYQRQDPIGPWDR